MINNGVTALPGEVEVLKERWIRVEVAEGEEAEEGGFWGF